MRPEGGVAGPLLVSVLGPLEVGDAGGTRRPVGGGKQRALLSMLVLHRGRAVTPGRLVDALWGEGAPAGAEVTLRSHVSHLRRLLADVGLGRALTTDPHGYRLVLGPEDVDADRFERLVGDGREALGLGRAEEAVPLLREALALWRGRPYPDLADVDGVEPEVARLEAVRLSAVESVVTADLAAGRHQEVVGELEGLVAEHPYHEGFVARLMLALYRSGRQADALEVYAAARERLADELGLDPGPELRELNRAVLRQDPSLRAQVVRGPRADGPGSAGARGTRPGAPGPGSAGHRPVAPARPPDAVFAALASTPTVGRDDEVTRLEDAWQAVSAAGHRVVLVSGPAGIGKTHLVARIADVAVRVGRPVLVGRCDATAAPYEPVRRALRPVTSATSPAAVLLEPPARADGGDREQEGPDSTVPRLAAAVASELASLAADGPVLLVLEDADRIDAASAALLGYLLGEGPSGVLVVVTYRDPPGGRHPPLLRLVGEVGSRAPTERVVLRPLGERPLADLVRPVLPGVDAVAARLREHTGGNPSHALEVARAVATGSRDPDAAWRVPPGVADALRLRLGALSEGARTVLPVAAALGSEVDVELLARVARRPEDEVADLLDEGVAAGLLVESGEEWAGRYAFPSGVVRDALRAEVTGHRLRTVHLHAAQALATRARPGRSGHAAVATHLRLAGTAADPAETADACLLAASEAAAVQAWDDALDHAEAAVALLADTGDRAAHARAAVATAMLWLRSGRDHARGLALLQSALADHVAVGDDAAAGGVHSRLGSTLSLHHSVMDVPRALEHFDAAERLLPDAATTYHLHRGRAQAAMLGLRTDVLAEAADRAAAIAAQSGRRDLAVIPDWAHGWAAVDEGRLADGLAAWESGWRVAHELADPYLSWSPVNAAAMVLNVHAPDPAAARAWCRRGLGLPRLASFVQPHAAVVDHLALALAAAGDVRAAREAADRLPPDAGSRRMLLLLDGSWEEAASSWAAAAEADLAAGDLHDAATNLRWLAEARLASGDREGAVVALEEALRLGVEGPQVPTELDARAVLARLLASERPVEASEHLARCDAVLARGEDWRGAVAQVELARATLAAASGDVEGLDTAARRAVDVLTRFGLRWREAAAERVWHDLLREVGRRAEAEPHLDRSRAAYATLGAHARWSEAVATP